MMIDVVQVGDDRGDRELPLEAERQVDHDADDDEGAAPSRRPRPARAPTCGPTNSLRDSRTGSAPPASHTWRLIACALVAIDGLRARPAALGLAQLAEDARDHHVLLDVAAHRHADQHVARAAEVLHLHVAEAAASSTARAHLGRCRPACAYWTSDHRAAGELDREVQAAGGQEEHRGEEGDAAR